MKANWLAAAALLAAGTDAAAAPQVPGTLAGVNVSFSSRPKFHQSTIILFPYILRIDNSTPFLPFGQIS
jgi:hypothetical protein